MVSFVMPAAVPALVRVPNTARLPCSLRNVYSLFQDSGFPSAE